MQLSIVVPVYNVGKYIDRCIESLESQDIEDYEIVVVNDASTDDSLIKLKKWEKKYENILIINKDTNTGLADTRNIGIQHAKGDYLIFVDSDDYIDQCCLGSLMLEMKTYEPDVLCCGYNVHIEDIKQVIYNYKSAAETLFVGRAFIENELAKRNIPITTVTACYRTKFITENGLMFEKGILHEDVRWSPQVYYKAERVYTSRQCFYHYVLRSNSISQQNDRKKNGRDLLETCKFLDDYAENIENDNLKKLLKNYIAMTYMKAVAVNRVDDHKEIVIERMYPLKRVCFLIDYIKAGIFCLSPKLYSHIYLFLKSTVRGVRL